MSIRLKISLLAIELILVSNIFSQTNNRSVTYNIYESPFTSSITMNGTLDGYNTYTHDYNIYVERTFQPMVKIIISNRGSKMLHSPRLIINNKKNGMILIHWLKKFSTLV